MLVAFIEDPQYNLHFLKKADKYVLELRIMMKIIHSFFHELHVLNNLKGILDVQSWEKLKKSIIAAYLFQMQASSKIAHHATALEISDKINAPVYNNVPSSSFV